MIDWTVREFKAYAAGRARDQRNQLQLAMWAAWHIAGFQRAKKLPRLDSLMRKLMGRRKAAQKTPRQLLEIAKMITGQMQNSGRRGK